MAMSTHIVGFKPADGHWTKMKAVWDACKAAGLPVPDAVVIYFNDAEPDAAGVYVKDFVRLVGVTYHEGPDEKGFEVDLRQIPPDIKIIRFYNSW